MGAINSLQTIFSPTRAKAVVYLLLLFLYFYSAIFEVMGLVKWGPGQGSSAGYLPVSFPPYIRDSQFVYMDSFCRLEIDGGGCYKNVYWGNVVAHLVIWYLVACVIVFGYNKLANKLRGM